MSDKETDILRGDFGATTPLVRPSETPPPVTPATEPPPPPTPPGPPSQPARRGFPFWILGIVAGVLLLAIAGVVIYFLLGSPGFTLVVVGAPPGSDVFVDNIRRGVTSADGTIRVPDLKQGKRLVRVSHTGYEDFNTTVTGKDGETKRLPVTLTQTSVEAKPEGLPNPINLNGPMILIPAGEFIMGDDNHNPEEAPAHKVTLPDYYIDKFEVTNEQYKKFSSETKRKAPSNPWWDNNYLNNPQMPVVGVSWSEATGYCQWAAKRLPTEEEWEKAASWGPGAEKKRQWPWGESAESGRANIGTDHPANVGQNPTGASAYGVHDMSGNVLEWVSSNFQAYQGNTTSNPNFGASNRVVRGGHFKSEMDDARTTRRFYAPPEFSAAEKRERSWLIGFRCAISADDPKLQERLRSQNK